MKFGEWAVATHRVDRVREGRILHYRPTPRPVTGLFLGWRITHEYRGYTEDGKYLFGPKLRYALLAPGPDRDPIRVTGVAPMPKAPPLTPLQRQLGQIDAGDTLRDVMKRLRVSRSQARYLLEMKNASDL